MNFTTSTMRVRPNFRENRLLPFLTVAYLAVWIVTAVDPVYPDDWLPWRKISHLPLYAGETDGGD